MSDEAPSYLGTMFNAADLMRSQFPPVEYVIPGLLPEGCTVLVAPPKIGKSWAVLDFGIAAACGGRALGRLKVDKRPVLYLALEDGQRRLQKRMSVLGVAEGPPGLDFITRVPDRAYVATVAEYLALKAGLKPLVVLDTLGKAMPPVRPNETTYQRDYRVVGTLKELVDDHPGSSIILVHHTRKSETSDFIDAVSGTQGLAGAADTIMLLKRERHEARAVLHVTSRDAQEGTYGLSFDAGVWTLAGNTLAEASREAATTVQTAGLGDRMAEIIAFVSQRPQGVRRADVAEALGMQPDDAGKYLRRAHEAGRVANPSRGLFSPLSFVSPLSLVEEDTEDEKDTYLEREA